MNYLVPPGKLEDSLPTTSSNSNVSGMKQPGTPTLVRKHCYVEDDEYLEDSDKAKEIINWLKDHKGVRAGHPDKMLQAHREKQKSVIAEKAGRAAVSCKIGNSSLLARRCGKKKP